MPPEVTAVITTHVRPLHVFDALASVRAEVQQGVEIIVVDDGGDFAGDDDLRVVRGGSVGVAVARNLGLAAACGEFVIFLDDDDVALPHRISTLLRAARRFDAALVFGLTSRVVPGTSISLAPVPTHLAASGPVSFGDVLACAPHTNAVLVRTDALRAVGGFDEGASHFDDWSAWLRIADRYARIRSVNEVVAEWRIHADGLSGQLLTIRAMKARLIALFDNLKPSLSPENARAVAMAREVVLANDVTTYDDYVAAAARRRPVLPSTANCQPTTA